jgi:sarcosine oxidase
VIGAGAMGSATAWQLAHTGRSVALIEQFGAAHNKGSSHGGSRIFRLSYRAALYTDLAARALSDWRELEADTGADLLEQNGQLDHGYKEAIDEIGVSLDRYNHPYERMDASEAHARWPGMNFEDHVIYSPDGGRCLADKTVTTLIDRSRELGVDVHLNTPVLGVHLDGDHAIIETHTQTWRTPSLVVAAGGWVNKLVGHLVKLPELIVDAGQPAHFQPIPSLKDESLWPSFLHHGANGRGGSPLEASAYGLYTPGEGVKVGTWSDRAAIDPDNRDFAISEKHLDEMKEYVSHWFPGLDLATAVAKTCLFTNTPNEDFILDRRGPITVCSPCSGHGFKFVPTIGKITAALAMGGTQSTPQWQLPN